MSGLQRIGGGPGGPGISSRDARSLDRTLSTIKAETAGDLAIIDAASQKYGKVQEDVTQLTQDAMVDLVKVGQSEAMGAQMVPHAQHRLSFLADQHANISAGILASAANDLRRLA